MRFLRNAISFVICIAIVGAGVYCVSLWNVDSILDSDRVERTLSHVEITEVLQENVTTGGEGENTSVLDRIYQITDRANISRDHVNAVVNSEAVKSLAAEYLSNVSQYVRTGEEKNITGEQLTGIVRENIDAINTEANLNLDDNTKQNIVSGVERHADELVTLLPTTKTLTESLSTEQIEQVRKILGEDTKLKLTYMVIGLSLLLILIQFSPYRFLTWHSASLFGVGVISLLLGFIIPSLLEDLLVEHNQVALLNVFEHFSGVISKSFYLYGACILLVSFIEISIYVSVHHHLKQREADKVRAALKEEGI